MKKSFLVIISIILIFLNLAFFSSCGQEKKYPLGDSEYELQYHIEYDNLLSSPQGELVAKYYMSKENLYLEIYQWEREKDVDLENAAKARFVRDCYESDDLNGIPAVEYKYEDIYNGEDCDVVGWIIAGEDYFIDVRSILFSDSDFAAVLSMIGRIKEK